MKLPQIKKLIRAKEQIEQGLITPARVWEVKFDGRGGFFHRTIDLQEFRKAQKAAWDKNCMKPNFTCAYTKLHSN